MSEITRVADSSTRCAKAGSACASAMSASAMSAATTIGYTPALYGTYWFGSIIDRNEAAGDIVRGYNIVFMILGVYAVLGVVFALVLRRRWDARARAARKDAVKEEVSAS